jgi:hypothetical protein
MDWIHLAQDRNQGRTIVNTIMNLPVLYNAGKFLSSCTTDDFSKKGSVPHSLGMGICIYMWTGP